jgi:murein DD-endopeptidase MepM/ murein hydrolase activator NlpD
MTGSARRIVWLITAAILCALFLRFCVRIVDAPPQPVPVADAGVSYSGPLKIPVAGVVASALTDTFTQSRERGSRPHDAIDIIAPRGTPVFAAADGRVEKLLTSERGGMTIYQRSSDDRWTYYYAHLDAYVPDLHEEQRLRAGDAIGTVGSTGNASADAPHLHFAVHRMADGERWYQGTPVNPYPLLIGARR